jgi:hypothetical protein
MYLIPTVYTYFTYACRGRILGRNWEKNLKTFAPCYSQSPQPAEFTPPYSFLVLEISTTTADSGWGLGIVYIISLKVALFFLLLRFIYMCIHLFPIETIIRNASKGGKPDRKPYHPYCFRNP